MKLRPTAQRVRELLHYEPETGIFTWRVRRGGTANAGSVAGAPDNAGYIQITVDGCNLRAHVLAWLYMTGRWPTRLVDHEDTNKANNRWLNLRLGTKALNAQNTKRLPSNNTSGVTGVSLTRSGRWCAQLKVAGRHVLCKTFDTKAEAVAARREAELKHHPWRT